MNKHLNKHWLPEQLNILMDSKLTLEEKYEAMSAWGYHKNDVERIILDGGWKSKTKRRMYVLDELDRLDGLETKKRRYKKREKKSGYVTVRLPDGERIYRYRLVAQLAIGSDLPYKMNVHHINGNNKDDRPSNLYLCYWEEHVGFHNGTQTPPTVSNLSQFVNSRVAQIRKT